VAAKGAETEPVPAVTEKLMLSPSATTWPWASVATALISLSSNPSAVRLLGLAVRAIVFTGPGIKLTEVFPDTPPTVAVIVAEVRLVELVRVTVAFPVVVVVAPDRVPAVVVKVKVVPSGTLLFAVSLTVAVITVVEVPLATISVLPAVAVTEPTEGATRVIVTVSVVLFEEVAVMVSIPPAGTVSGAV
jgi:hypothetical protein